MGPTGKKELIGQMLPKQEVSFRQVASLPDTVFRTVDSIAHIYKGGSQGLAMCSLKHIIS